MSRRRPPDTGGSGNASTITIEGSSSSTQPAAKRRRPCRDDLLWKGILRQDQLKRLEDISDFVVCPGYTGNFGGADKWGKLYLPGATSGYSATRSILMTWRRKTHEDERYNWWSEKVKEIEGLEPVRAIDIVQGNLYLTTWKHYITIYAKHAASRSTAKVKQRHIEQAAADAAQHQDAHAASTLLSLAPASRELRRKAS